MSVSGHGYGETRTAAIPSANVVHTDRNCAPTSSSSFPPYRHFSELNLPDTARLTLVRRRGFCRMSDDGSVFSRFLVKFVEIIAAGLATAVSGYLIAHLSGVLSSPASGPAQAVIEAAPNASLPAQSSPSSHSGDSNEQHAATKEEVVSPAPQPARPINSAKIALPRKHTATATAAESNRDQESLVARVKDALANVDASRRGLPALPGDVRLDPATPASQPPAALSRGAVTGTTPPSIPTQPAQLDPLNAIEIQSRPVAAAQPPPTPPAETEPGIASTLEQMLRHDPLAGSEEAPRPPMPIGQ
jgi:hypothetical protein